MSINIALKVQPVQLGNRLVLPSMVTVAFPDVRWRDRRSKRPLALPAVVPRNTTCDAISDNVSEQIAPSEPRLQNVSQARLLPTLVCLLVR